MKFKAPRKKIAALLSFVMCLAMIFTVFASAYNGTKYYAGFNSMTEAKIAAEQLTKELVSEGAILMKNDDGTLPLTGSEWVSVFGVTQDDLAGCSDTSGAIVTGNVDDSIADALERAGFIVNPTLKQFYANNSNGIGKEVTDFGGMVEETFKNYNDAAVIVFSRDGGEGSDAARVTSEEATQEDIDSHRALYTKKEEATTNPGGNFGGGEQFGGDQPGGFGGGEQFGGDQPGGFGGGEQFGGDQPGGEQEAPAATEPTYTYTTYKHYLMLTESERALIAKVKAAGFKKIVIVLNTSNVMEVSELQNDPEIGAIIDIGRPGMGGLNALAEILNGTVNPSGSLVDEWMTDLTADPTWYNFGSNNQTAGLNGVGVGSTLYLYEDGTKTGAKDSTTAYDDNGYHGVDYEEGIYLGYKYYETYYFDKYSAATTAAAREEAQQWWENNVTYPFGYGLSYTTFSFNAGGLFTDEDCSQALGASVQASRFNSSIGNPAEVEKLYVPVTVTNTGSVAGKKTVQVYVTAPYTKGGIEKASVVLVGYAKTDLLAPGASQTVVVSFNVQDFASWDYNDKNGDGVKGDYELDAGEYIVRVMENSHFDCTTVLADTTDAYDEVRFTLVGAVHQSIDDFSHNALCNLFSEENGSWDENTQDHDLAYNNVRTADMMADGTSGMTTISRVDMDATFPQAPTAGDVTFKNNILSNWAYWDNFRVTDNRELDSNNLPTGAKTWDASYDDPSDPWYKEASDIPSNWTQAAGTYDKNHQLAFNRTTMTFPMYVSSAEESPIKFADMAGVAYDDPKWDEFLNQLTYDELCTVVEFGGYCTVDIASVGKLKHMDTDGPNILDGTHRWCSEDIISSTWNLELAYKEGVMMGTLGLLHGVQGWYAPGADVHRSPFSGRNNEYYSQDGIQGGYMAAAVVQGVQSKGVVCYIKHCFMNDQETDRGNLFTWADEQTIRENYCKMFQMALQEGDCKAAMTGYGRLAGFSNTGNYNLSTKLYKEQWGTQAYFVTDGYIGWINRTDLDIMVRTGNQMELYTNPYVEYLSGEWDAEKNTVLVGPGEWDSKLGGYYVDGEDQSIESPTQWYAVRMAAKGILYQISDMAAQFNGYSELTVAGGNLAAATQGVKYSASVSISQLLDTDSTYTISVTGNLPAGITANAINGEISGTPTEVGTFFFTVNYVIDGYIEKSANYTLTVNPAFYTDGDSFAEATVGEDFYTEIKSDEFKTPTYDTVSYAVKSGNLPAGLTLSAEGVIEGNPTEAGTFNLVIEMTATKESSGGKGKQSSTTTTKLDYEVTIVVAGDSEAPAYEENVPYVGENGNWFVNGNDTGVKAQGEKGDTGATGATGAQGEKGEAGASGCGGVIGIGGGIVAIVTILGTALIARKKED